MKISRIGRWAALAAVGSLALTACGSDDATGSGDSGSAGSDSSVSGTLSGVGASSQQAAMTAWQSGYQSAHSGATVQYSPDGSGAGREAFLAGGASFAGSDVPLTDDEVQKAKSQCGDGGAMDIPVYVSPISVAFNLKGIDSLNLDAKTIAEIFSGKITQWNDPAIADQNEGTDLPDTKITTVHRSDDSGTTKNFTDYLADASQGAWTEKASGNWPSGLSGEANKGTSGVVSTTKTTEGAITYADSSAVGDLGAAKIKAGDGYVSHEEENVARAVENAKRLDGRSEHDIALEIDHEGTDGAYPIVLVSYHIICSAYDKQETVNQVKAFETYVTSEDGQKAAADAAHSTPLPQKLRDEAKAAIDTVKTK
ncbi:phosphate ABC transporter substrate-binding protein PstS [Rothia kristinae]|uniref:phosphate ABC transporter substrate-binding protein PstS n=1 Tax=Rothia kristinae TaxID=37923 RepID=UPI0022E62C54|nr:phosphate ABC transporter substrate-binding protein PstS [Rothia kristinae]